MDDVNLYEFYNTLIKKKNTILKSTIFFLILGILISIILPVSFKSSLKFTFSDNKSEKSNVSTLANLVPILEEIQKSNSPFLTC